MLSILSFTKQSFKSTLYDTVFKFKNYYHKWRSNIQVSYIFSFLYSCTQKVLANGLLMMWLSFRILILTSASCCHYSLAIAAFICFSGGATWLSNTRNSTQCCISASFRAFYISSAVSCRCAALRPWSSSRTVRCLSTRRTLLSHRHAWTAFASTCCLRFSPRRRETSWSRSHLDFHHPHFAV